MATKSSSGCGQTQALQHIPPVGGVASPVFSSLPDARVLPSQTPWLPREPLGIKWVNSNGRSWTTGISIGDGSQWNVSAFHPIARISLIKGEPGQQHTWPNFKQPSQPWLSWLTRGHGPIFAFMLNCCSGVSKSSPLGENFLEISFLRDTQNVNQKHAHKHTKATIQGFARTFLIPSELQTLWVVTKMHSFTFQNI